MIIHESVRHHFRTINVFQEWLMVKIFGGISQKDIKMTQGKNAEA